MSCATNDTTRPPREEWSRVAPRLRPTHSGSPRASDALWLRTPTDSLRLASGVGCPAGSHHHAGRAASAPTEPRRAHGTPPTTCTGLAGSAPTEPRRAHGTPPTTCAGRAASAPTEPRRAHGTPPTTCAGRAASAPTEPRRAHGTPPTTCAGRAASAPTEPRRAHGTPPTTCTGRAASAPMTKHVVVGTAGHIDHGKTSLVKALTGIDTDRLPEEKARGITIDLGFAFLEEPAGLVIEIVDVPGHERFVKNMLAGVGGIDLAMLVVAADEGVMPQTREHLAICSLLHVKSGLVVLTKTDLVERDWLELVKDEVAALVRGTFLEGTPLLAVSSKTGEGLLELRAALRSLAEVVAARGLGQLPRLPVDRVFTVRGFGTVVTGTLTAGRLAVDDRVQVYPKGVEAKIRGLQTHGHPVTEAFAGQRTAINLQGVERTAVERGDVVGLAGTLVSSLLADAVLEILHDAPPPPTSP